MAEGVGFEPTVGFPTSVFKTDAIDHSATPPVRVADGDLQRLGQSFKQNPFKKIEFSHLLPTRRSQFIAPQKNRPRFHEAGLGMI